MDGFKKREHIFVLGATNSEKDLDPAALRPGRFDKIVHVPLPDSIGRREIVEYYLSKIKMPLAADVSAAKLASITPGFSGAEIENMVNLAIIDAVDNSKPEISKEEFENSRDRVVLGIKRKPKNISDRVLLQTAIHEAGHTLVCFKDKICNKSIHKVTILPRGESKGATSTFQDDDFQGSKEEFISLIDMSLAGIMAEELYFGDQKMGTGCGRDLERANRIAKQMVQKFAMNNFGYMVIDEGNYLHHRISEVTRNEMDQSVGDMLNTRSDLVREILNLNISELKLLAQNLVEYGELDRTDIDNIFQGKKVEKSEDKKLRNVIIDNIPI
jgi:ATP-dependent metalloprotease